MIPWVPIVAGLTIAYVVNRAMTPNKKDKSDDKVCPDGGDSGSGDSYRQQNPASHKDRRDSVKTDPETVEVESPGQSPDNSLQETNDEISPNGTPVLDVRSDQPSDDLSGEQLPDPEKSSQQQND